MMSIIHSWRSESEEIKPNIFIPSEKANRALNRDIKILVERIENNPIGRRLLEKIRLCSFSDLYCLWTQRRKSLDSDAGE